MSIQFKGSNIAGISPAPNEIDERELAINTFDKKIYSKTPSGNIIEIGSDNVNTGLETVTGISPTDIGHRFISESANNHGDIGELATDLTVATEAGSYGATGAQSFTAGVNTTASGIRSTAIGDNSVASGVNSVAIGQNNTAGDDNSVIIGSNSSTSSSGVHALGANQLSAADNTTLIGNNNRINSVTSIDTTLVGIGLLSNSPNDFIVGSYNTDVSGRVFIVGNGTSDVTRSNVLEITDSGVVLAPLSSVSDISNQTKGLVTTEFLESPSTIGVSSVNGLSGTVTLETADIPETVGTTTNRWMTTAEKTQLSSNAVSILGLENDKEPNLPVNSNEDYFLSSDASNSRIWVPNPLTTLRVGDLQDIDSIDQTAGNPDANKFLRIDPTVPQGHWVTLDRNMLSEPIIQESLMSSGYSFNSNPDNWPINADTVTALNNKQDSFLGPSLVVPTPLPAYQPTPVLVAYNYDGIDDGAGRSTNFQPEWVDLGVGLISDLTTAATDTVSAINAIDSKISAGGQGLNFRTETTAFTVTPGDYAFVDSSTGVFDIAIPTGTIGDTFYIFDISSSFSSNNVTLIPSGTDTIMGVNSNFALNIDDKEYKIIHTGIVGNEWRII